MTVESASYLNDLNDTYPASGDPRSEGDNHLRLLKTVLKATLPGLAGRMNRVQTKTADYTAAVTDNCTVLNFTTAAVLTLPAAATAGNGFAISVLANGVQVTLDPNASELINGQSTIVLASGSSGVAYCNGSAWHWIPAMVASLAQNQFIGRYSASSGVPEVMTLGAGFTNTMGTVSVSDANASVTFKSLGIGTAASGTTGEIRATGNITAYYTSDIRWKQNISEIPDALSTVEAIGGKLFEWTDEYTELRGGVDGFFLVKEDFGVIAQDVQQAFPRAVRTRPDGYLVVDYQKLVALAFAAITELRKEVAELRAAK